MALSYIKRCNKYYSIAKRSDLRLLAPEDLNFFRSVVGQDHVLESDLVGFNTDWTGKYTGASKCILRPKTNVEISQILKYCSAHRLGVVTQSGNTGLVGGSVPVFDEIVLSMTRMNSIIGVDHVSGIVDVEAGCVLENIDTFLKDRGFMMPIGIYQVLNFRFGGKGIMPYRRQYCNQCWGVKIDQVQLCPLILDMEVYTELSCHWKLCYLLGRYCSLVIVWQFILGKPLRKDNTGYDLKHLFIGSEGTLGIITRASILIPQRPKSVQVALLALPEFKNTLSALCMAKKELGEILSAFEFFDSTSFNLVLKHIPNIRNVLQDKSPFYVLLETAGSDPNHDSEKLTNLLEKLMEENIVSDGSLAQDESQASLMWSIRESISQACSTQGGNHKYDISVPINDFYRIVDDVKSELESLDLYDPSGDKLVTHVAAFGHLGDGNVHLNIMAKKTTLEFESQLSNLVFSKIVEMNGSISAEHGIGLLKAGHLHLAKSPQVISLMKHVKRMIDPNSIMNPYKMF
jgi:FAD/FMN-containing dehydrogenase